MKYNTNNIKKNTIFHPILFDLMISISTPLPIGSVLSGTVEVEASDLKHEAGTTHFHKKHKIKIKKKLSSRGAIGMAAALAKLILATGAFGDPKMAKQPNMECQDHHPCLSQHSQATSSNSFYTEIRSLQT